MYFTTYIKNQSDEEFIGKLLPEWSGAIPANIIYNVKGEILTSWVGESNFKQFEEKIKPYLNL